MKHATWFLIIMVAAAALACRGPIGAQGPPGPPGAQGPPGVAAPHDHPQTPPEPPPGGNEPEPTPPGDEQEPGEPTTGTGGGGSSLDADHRAAGYTPPADNHDGCDTNHQHSTVNLPTDDPSTWRAGGTIFHAPHC